MQNITIKYNPYKLETEVLIGDAMPKQNSKFNNIGNKRLQEWIDDLPDILYEECNTKEFKFTFQGISLDYEDVLSIAKSAKEKGIEIDVAHIPAKEVKDKEKEIEKIFRDIQAGPFEALKSSDIVKAFELAKSSDFEVNVIATMSAGKSTLINALLGRRLMPAKQEACTAIITEIKDNDNDLGVFVAKEYDKNGNVLESYDNLSRRIMEGLNSNPNVSRLRTEGNIPFVMADDVSLVLVDTPGPNNSRDPEHAKTTYRMLSDSSKALVIYIMNATQLAVNDDNELLSRVAKSMNIGGKQSRDRFIFVVNKLDEFKPGEDSIEAAIQKVKHYLADHNIENPNVYPASALTALDIRTTLLESDDDDDDEIFYAKGKVRKFNNNEVMHFEKYAPLPVSIKNRINIRLEESRKEGNSNEQALIHSGIVSIEEAIRMYVIKYAKTAKIKNIVDTFRNQLDSTQEFEKTKCQIHQNKEKRGDILKRIDEIKQKIQNGEEAKQFKKQIDAVQYGKNIKEKTDELLMEVQKEITKYIESEIDCEDQKIEKRQAEEWCAYLSERSRNVKKKVEVEIENIIENSLIKNTEDILNIYKQKLSNLVKEVNVDGIEINPFKMMIGEIPKENVENIISELAEKEAVKVGENWVENTNKKWYFPWTWFEEEGHFESIMEDREFVDKTKFVQEFFSRIQSDMYEYVDAASTHANEQINNIIGDFANKFKQLDDVLKDKLEQLRSFTEDEENMAKAIKGLEEKVDWLNKIQSRLDAILDL